MVDKKHYIKLTCLTRLTGDDVGHSWIISYNKNQNCFICENKSNNKITKMKNVENFVRIWNHYMHKAIKGLPGSEYAHNNQPEAFIEIFIENDYYSGYTISVATPVPVELIQKYIYLLKDIIEENEKDKDSKKVDEDDEKAAEKLKAVQRLG